MRDVETGAWSNWNFVFCSKRQSVACVGPKLSSIRAGLQTIHVLLIRAFRAPVNRVF